MAKSPVEHESRQCTCAGKEDQPAHSPRGPGPSDTRINARRLPQRPVVAILVANGVKEEAPQG